MFYIYRKFPRKYVEIANFEKISDANRFKKNNNLSGVVISQLSPEEFNYRHRSQFKKTYDDDTVDILKELGDEIIYISDRLNRIDTLFKKLKRRIK